MMGLKTHTLTEAMRARHVLTLHRYNELFKDRVSHETMSAIGVAWAKVVKDAKFKLSKEAKGELLLRHPKSLTAVDLAHNAKTLYGISVSLAVKAPLALGPERLEMLARELFDAAEAAMRQALSDWPEAFSRETAAGQLQTDFKVQRTHNEVSLIISSIDGALVHTSVLMRVVREPGKPSSKLRNYEQFYFSGSSKA